MRIHPFVAILFFIAAFVGGLVVSPYLEAPRHELTNWVTKPFLPQVEPTTITLYFSCPDEACLVASQRTVAASESLQDQMKTVLEELTKGPAARQELLPTLPAGTRLRAVYTYQETIYVDLSHAFSAEQPGGTAGELTSIYSIVNTLLENFPQFRQVQLLVEGQPARTLAGHIDLQHPFRYKRSVVRPTNL